MTPEEAAERIDGIRGRLAVLNTDLAARFNPAAEISDAVLLAMGVSTASSTAMIALARIEAKKGTPAERVAETLALVDGLLDRAFTALAIDP